jgi:hypothetical protein
MKRLPLVCAALLVAVSLAACGERNTQRAKKADRKAWEGTENAQAAPGWKAGDQASWENQLRTRAQAQNEYAKAK